MSMVEHKGQGDKDVFDDVYYANSYVCVDSDAEVLPNSYKAHNDGSLIYMEGAHCSGMGAMRNCSVCGLVGRSSIHDWF